MLALWSLAILSTGQELFASDAGQSNPAMPPVQLAPFTNASGSDLHPAWVLEYLPDKSVARTSFEGTRIDRAPALRVRSDRSYGLVRHAWPGAHPGVLAWRWRLDEALSASDLQTRQGDDASIKVCVMFDQPISEVPFLERMTLQLARQVSQKDLPSATLCYVWDTKYARGQSGHNPYTARVRYLVVDDASSPRKQWVEQVRSIKEDFALMFGSESSVTPPVRAILVGADSDNTQQRSLAFVQNLRWLTP